MKVVTACERAAGYCTAMIGWIFGTGVSSMITSKVVRGQVAREVRLGCAAKQVWGGGE